MKAMTASRILYDYSKLEETESALAISPCPRIEESKDDGKNTQFTCKRSGLDRRSQDRTSPQTVFDDDDLTATLTVGWAIALVSAVAVVVYVSGG
jgi:hypothetical protein